MGCELRRVDAEARHFGQAFHFVLPTPAAAIATVEGIGITDDVVDLMVRKIERLPEVAQQAVKLAACIGNRFDLHTLAIASQGSHREAAADLKEVVREGLIVPLSHASIRLAEFSELPRTQNPRSATFRFLHDRVQQAAHALIPDDRKQVVHLRVGQLMLRHNDDATLDEQLFEIVRHLNIGSGLITDEAEHIRVISRLSGNLKTCSTGLAPPWRRPRSTASGLLNTRTHGGSPRLGTGGRPGWRSSGSPFPRLRSSARRSGVDLRICHVCRHRLARPGVTTPGVTPSVDSPSRSTSTRSASHCLKWHPPPLRTWVKVDPELFEIDRRRAQQRACPRPLNARSPRSTSCTSCRCHMDTGHCGRPWCFEEETYGRSRRPNGNLG